MFSCTHAEESFVLVGRALVCEVCGPGLEEDVETTGVFPAFVEPAREAPQSPCKPELRLVAS